MRLRLTQTIYSLCEICLADMCACAGSPNWPLALMPREVLKSSAPDILKIDALCQELVARRRGSEVFDFARKCVLRGTRDDKGERSVTEALRNIQRGSRAWHPEASRWVAENAVRIVRKTYSSFCYREALLALLECISGLSSDPSAGTLDL